MDRTAHIIIAEIIRKYGPWGPYIAQHIGKLSKIGKSKILLKNQTFSNGHIYKFHASKIQNITNIQIYRKSSKKTKKISNSHQDYVDTCMLLHLNTQKDVV